MTTLTEGLHTAESLISEAAGERSRAAVVCASGAAITACMVLGKITASGKYAPLDQDATDGSQAAAGISFGAYDSASADADGVAFVRDCEHNAKSITWPSDITEAEKATAIGQLAALGIILR